MNDSLAILPPRRLLLATDVCARSRMARAFMDSRSGDLLRRLACDILLVHERGGGDGRAA